MSTKLAGYDAMVVCPYNKSHVILRERFQFHLVRCARNYPDIQFEVCPFDVTHRLSKEDMTVHVEECPARVNFDRYVYSVNTDDRQPAREPPRPQPPRVDDEEENWDHYHTPTYDPQAYAANANVLRNPSLLTPAERRRFADAERRRLSELQRQGQGQQ